jgi:ferredoxin--NADP+ reductase
MSPKEPIIPAGLLSRVGLADGLAVLTISLERDFLFRPGQHATLWLTHHGITIPRPYSIASSPNHPRRLEFYLNLVAEGQMTPSLWDPEVVRALEARDDRTGLAVTGPKGRFCLDPDDKRDLIFIASGTGLAPFMSMIRKMEEDSRSGADLRPRRIYLVHGVNRPAHLGYRAELEGLAADTISNPQRRLALVYLPTVSQPHPDPAWDGLRGRAESLLQADAESGPHQSRLQTTVRAMLCVLLRPETHAVYVCGHPGTVSNTVRILTAMGYRLGTDVMSERFFPERTGAPPAPTGPRGRM